MAGPSLSRRQILRFRRRVGALDSRLAMSPSSLRQAAWAGLQDSMPRAAILSIHARIETTTPDVLDDPSLCQLWGPRFSAFVVAEADRGLFTVGRMPETGPRRKRGEDLAERLEDLLSGGEMTYADAGRALGVNPNSLRYAAPTGRVLLRWEGAGQPVIWMVPPPDIDPADARVGLARRYLHVFGPGTPEGFGEWAGIATQRARAIFAELTDVIEVGTPVGPGWALAEDEHVMVGMPDEPEDAVRLLPSGDAYYLLQGDARELLVPDAGRRASLWTSRVWPGAVLMSGEIVGIWRRAGNTLDVETWRTLSAAEKARVEAEASSLPLPGLESSEMKVRWET